MAVNFYEEVDDKLLKFAVIIAKTGNVWNVILFGNQVL